MRNQYLLVGAFALLVTACSSSSESADGGDDAGAGGNTATDTGKTTYYLTTGDYVITGVNDLADGCKIGVDQPYDSTTQEGFIGATLPLTVDNTSGDVTWGNTQGNPPVPSLGQGNIQANQGTLSMMTMITADAPSMCTLNRMVTADINVIGDYRFTAKITRTDSMRMMCDTADLMLGATCTSTWTWTVTKQMTDGGTSGG